MSEFEQKLRQQVANARSRVQPQTDRPTFDEFFLQVREAGADGWDKVEDIEKEINDIRGK